MSTSIIWLEAVSVLFCMLVLLLKDCLISYPEFICIWGWLDGFCFDCRYDYPLEEETVRSFLKICFCTGIGFDFRFTMVCCWNYCLEGTWCWFWW